MTLILYCPDCLTSLTGKKRSASVSSSLSYHTQYLQADLAYCYTSGKKKQWMGSLTDSDSSIRTRLSSVIQEAAK